MDHQVVHHADVQAAEAERRQPVALDEAGLDVRLAHLPDPRLEALDVDLDRVHLGQHHYQAGLGGNGPSGQAGACASRHDRHPVMPGQAHYRSHFGRGLGERDELRITADHAGIDAVNPAFERLCEHPVVAEKIAQFGGERHA